MTLAHVVLGVLAGGPAHGYDLKRAYDARFPGTKPLAYGQVYATLGRLQRDGHVEEAEVVQDKGPERIVYAITDSGEQELRSWLETTEQAGGYAADELVRKTVTALHLGSDAEGFLQRQRAVHLDALRVLTREQGSSTDVGRRIALDHTIAHLDADLRWLESARERVAAERTLA